MGRRLDTLCWVFQEQASWLLFALLLTRDPCEFPVFQAMSPFDDHPGVGSQVDQGWLAGLCTGNGVVACIPVLKQENAEVVRPLDEIFR